MNTIKNLEELKDIRNNAVEELFNMIPNYKAAKLFADELNCDILDTLIIVNNLIPNVDIYFKNNQYYYHIYGFNIIHYKYSVKILWFEEGENEDGIVITKWHKNIDFIEPYMINMDSEIITKEEFEAKEALTK